MHSFWQISEARFPALHCEEQIMDNGITIYCGTGRGKTAAAIGSGVQAACEGKVVVMISFLKGQTNTDLDFLRKLEPDIKVFNFDKYAQSYSFLTPSQQEEEQAHVRNGLNYAKKVLQTEECDMLILDEVLDLPSCGIVSEDELIPLLMHVPEKMELIMTGTARCEKLWKYVGRVTEVTTLKESGDRIIR